jgi:hypothetical protein
LGLPGAADVDATGDDDAVEMAERGREGAAEGAAEGAGDVVDDDAEDDVGAPTPVVAFFMDATGPDGADVVFGVAATFVAAGVVCVEGKASFGVTSPPETNTVDDCPPFPVAVLVLRLLPPLPTTTTLLVPCAWARLIVDASTWGDDVDGSDDNTGDDGALEGDGTISSARIISTFCSFFVARVSGCVCKSMGGVRLLDADAEGEFEISSTQKCMRL